MTKKDTPLEAIALQVNDIVQSELGWTEIITEGVLADKLDSMQLLSLSVAIEDHFEICFEPEEEEKIQTYSDLLALIKHKMDATP